MTFSNNQIVSIIIPCFNESDRLPQFLESLIEYYSGQTDIEFIVVDDGSDVIQMTRVKELVAQYSRQATFPLKFISILKNQGKGNAIQVGFNNSSGEIVGFVDADGSISPQELKAVYQTLIESKRPQQLSVAIASRIRMLGKKIERSTLRHYIGRVFASYVSLLFQIPVYDTQCGCKMFRKKDIEHLLPLTTDSRWLWDTQLLILCFMEGKEIVEVPISWIAKKGSKLSLMKDGLKMVIGLYVFKRHILSMKNKPDGS